MNDFSRVVSVKYVSRPRQIIPKTILPALQIGVRVGV